MKVTSRIAGNISAELDRQAADVTAEVTTVCRRLEEASFPVSSPALNELEFTFVVALQKVSALYSSLTGYRQLLEDARREADTP